MPEPRAPFSTAKLCLNNEKIRFWLRVKPRASREALTVEPSGELCLRLHAPPTDGAANAACIEFLARWLHLPKSAIEIERGAHSRRKLIGVRVDKSAARQLRSFIGPEKQIPPNRSRQ